MMSKSFSNLKPFSASSLQECYLGNSSMAYAFANHDSKFHIIISLSLVHVLGSGHSGTMKVLTQSICTHPICENFDVQYFSTYSNTRQWNVQHNHTNTVTLRPTSELYFRLNVCLNIYTHTTVCDCM